MYPNSNDNGQRLRYPNDDGNYNYRDMNSGDIGERRMEDGRNVSAGRQAHGGEYSGGGGYERYANEQ